MTEAKTKCQNCINLTFKIDHLQNVVDAWEAEAEKLKAERDEFHEIAERAAGLLVKYQAFFDRLEVTK